MEAIATSNKKLPIACSVIMSLFRWVDHLVPNFPGPGDDQTDLRGNEEAMKILKRRGFAVLACQGNRSRHVLQREGWRQIQNPVRSSISKHHASHWLTPSISANFMNAQSCRCFCVPGWTCRAPTPMTKMDFHYQRPVWSTRPASWSSAHRTPCLPMARSQARPT